MPKITLYASVENPEAIKQMIMDELKGFTIEEQDNQLIVAKQGVMKKKKYATISTKIKKHNDEPNRFTQGFLGYLVAELKGPDALKETIIAQAIQANSIISFDIKNKRIEKFWGHFLHVTSAIGGIILLPSGYILNSNGDEVVDDDGNIVANELNLNVMETEVQYGNSATPTIENQGRRKATHAKLAAQKINFASQLPLLPDSKNISIRSPKAIAKRAAALLILIQYVRELIDDKEQKNSKASRRMSEVFLNRYGVRKSLTAREERFLAQEHYEEQELINFMWLYESVWVLVWSIGIVDEMKEPTTICDVDILIQIVLDNANIGELLEMATPRSASSIMDRMDENYCYHWACVESRINGLEPPANLDEGVVMERQRAFNWLIQLNDESWDDITLNT